MGKRKSARKRVERKQQHQQAFMDRARQELAEARALAAQTEAERVALRQQLEAALARVAETTKVLNHIVEVASGQAKVQEHRTRNFRVRYIGVRPSCVVRRSVRRDFPRGRRRWNR